MSRATRLARYGTRRLFRSWTRSRLRETGRWLLLAGGIGLVAGLGAIVFDRLFLFCSRWLLAGLGGFQPPAPGTEQVVEPFGPLALWRLPVVTILGGLASGLLVSRLAPEAEGHGTDGVIAAFHTGLGKIRRRVPFVKMLTSSITIGAGGSAGREGPIAQIGAGIGSFLGDLLKLTNRERRILMLAGVAAGVGSIFRAPLGAALFAGEVLYRDPEFETESLMPGLISAIVGYAVYATYAGWEPMFITPALEFHSPLELVVYAALGLCCAGVAILYINVFSTLHHRVFRPLPVPDWCKPALGAALLGLLALAFPAVLGMGYGYVQQVIDGERVILWMLLFVAAKILATSCTIASGGSGGVFAPSLAIGGVLGGAFGAVADRLFPDAVSHPAAFVMVGMGAFFAGAAKVPLAAVVMVMEMTGSYGLLVPTLLAATIAYLLTPQRTSLYENQVAGRIDSPAHLGSFAVDLLEEVRVRDVIRERTAATLLPASLPVADLLQRFRDDQTTAYALVDQEEHLAGLVTVEAIRRALLLDTMYEGIVVYDLADQTVEPVTLDDDLRTVLQAFVAHETDVMPVVEARGSRTVVGTLSRGDVLLAYDRELRRRRQQR